MSERSRESLIEAYLDGTLSAEERSRFEAEIAADPELFRLIELQGWMDAELAEQYAYQAPPGGYVPAPAPLPIRRGIPTWVRPLALAAAVVLVAAGVWFGLVKGGGGGGARPGRVVSPNAVYAKLESRGWEPEFVCTDDAGFQAAVEKRVGSPLLLEPDPEIRALGWAYNAGFSGKIVGDHTMMLLTLVGKERVLVLMDQLSGDRKLEVDPGSPLHVFRRVIGPLVVYEVTPLDKPHVIERLFDPRTHAPPK